MDNRKASPILDDDAWMYCASPEEVAFVFATRSELDWGDGLRFNARYVKTRGWHVGLLPYDRDDEEEVRLRHVFDVIQSLGAPELFGCAAIPNVSSSSGQQPPDRSTFDPPLVGKVLPTMDGFVSIRRSHVGIYSGAYYLFPHSLKFCLLDANGQYSLVAGSREFVEECLQSSTESSWEITDAANAFSPGTLMRLREAAKAYSIK